MVRNAEKRSQIGYCEWGSTSDVNYKMVHLENQSYFVIPKLSFQWSYLQDICEGKVNWRYVKAFGDPSAKKKQNKKKGWGKVGREEEDGERKEGRWKEDGALKIQYSI